jgi:NADH-quinone oxidoreductase subunit G
VAAALGRTIAAGPQALAATAGLRLDEIQPLADALRSAELPVILLGPRAHSSETVRAWRAAGEASGARVTWLPRRAGTYGALAAGAHPELLPGGRLVDDESARGEVSRAWGSVLPAAAGSGAAAILRRAADGALDALWLVGADVIGDLPDAELGRKALDGARFVVVQDVQWSELAHHADVVLPAAAFVERDGTLTDWEGRRQPVHSAVDPPGAARADYAILAEAARRLGRPIGCRTAADTRAELDALLESRPVPAAADGAVHAEAPRPSAEFGLRLLTYRLLYDDASRIRATGGVRQLTPGAFAEINPADAERAGISDDQPVRLTSAHGTVAVKARLTKAIREGVVYVPWRQPDVSAQSLCAVDDPHPAIRAEPA